MISKLEYFLLRPKKFGDKRNASGGVGKSGNFIMSTTVKTKKQVIAKLPLFTKLSGIGLSSEINFLYFLSYTEIRYNDFTQRGK